MKVKRMPRAATAVAASIAVAVFAAVFAAVAPAAAAARVPVPPPPAPPLRYDCPRIGQPPVIDGRLDDAAWAEAPWTRDFADIEGELKPAPSLRTRAKLAWDDDALYVAAELEEPHVWATLRERDSVIYHDDDFEIFLDPDGDRALYYELEINALGTEWDLLLVRTYIDGGPAVNGWDIAGLETAVHVDGTLNDPTDQDRGWTVEMALPWAALKECAGRMSAPPRPGDIWRLNFSRVDWPMRVVDGRYEKDVDPLTRERLPERNWVWSPQGVINMHLPERWGFLRFQDHPADDIMEGRHP